MSSAPTRPMAVGIVIGLMATVSPLSAQEPWQREIEGMRMQVEVLARTAARGVALAAAQSVEPQQREIRRKMEQQRRAAERQRRLEQQQRNSARSGPESTERFSRTVRLPRNGMFELSNVTGDIVITGGGGNDVRIDAVKRVRTPVGPQARELLQEIDIQVLERNGFVEVRTEYPRRGNVWGAVDYTITLPDTANVSVRTVAGDVRVTSVKGELRAESVSGNLVMASSQRLRTLKSLSGGIQISDAESDDISVGSVSGDITVRNLRARAIDIETVSGDLSVTDARSDRVNLKSINGGIGYSGPLTRNGRYEMQSHSGDIRVAPVGNTGFEVEANTFNGEVRSDFALKLGGSPGPNGPRRGPRFNRTIRGAFGDGSAILFLRSFSGDLEIVKQ